MFKSFLVFTMLLGQVAVAQQPQVSALTFTNWKEQQILEAQNQVLRISARLSQMKNGKSESNGDGKEADLPSAKFKKAEGQTVATAERDLRRAQDSLKGANAASLEEYALVYLPTLRETPEAVQTLSQKLSKEELAEIFKALLLKEAPADTKRNGNSLADGLASSTLSR